MVAHAIDNRDPEFRTSEISDVNRTMANRAIAMAVDTGRARLSDVDDLRKHPIEELLNDLGSRLTRFQ